MQATRFAGHARNLSCAGANPRMHCTTGFRPRGLRAVEAGGRTERRVGADDPQVLAEGHMVLDPKRDPAGRHLQQIEMLRVKSLCHLYQQVVLETRLSQASRLPRACSKVLLMPLWLRDGLLTERWGTPPGPVLVTSDNARRAAGEL